MPSIIHLSDIKKALPSIDVISAISEGFIHYSNGNSVVPPVGELLFENPPGDVHIKYGYIKNDDYYVIKIASGFYENQVLGIPSGQGLMLLFNQKTGELLAILLDEGHLTNIRTSAAGALVAKHFGPQKVKGIGIIGTGIQAKLQLEYIQKVKPCNTVWVWGRNHDHSRNMQAELKGEYDIQLASSSKEIGKNCNVIVTTTPSETPLLSTSDISVGSLIIAVGSDAEHKQELECGILANADVIVADSIPQSKSRGEIYQAMKSGAITESQVIELGRAIQHPELQRTSEDQTIVVDLTGVAVQDIMIASAVYNQFSKTQS